VYPKLLLRSAAATREVAMRVDAGPQHSRTAEGMVSMVRGRVPASQALAKQIALREDNRGGTAGSPASGLAPSRPAGDGAGRERQPSGNAPAAAAAPHEHHGSERCGSAGGSKRKRRGGSGEGLLPPPRGDGVTSAVPLGPDARARAAALGAPVGVNAWQRECESRAAQQGTFGVSEEMMARGPYAHGTRYAPHSALLAPEMATSRPTGLISGISREALIFGAAPNGRFVPGVATPPPLETGAPSNPNHPANHVPADQTALAPAASGAGGSGYGSEEAARSSTCRAPVAAGGAGGARTAAGMNWEIAQANQLAREQGMVGYGILPNGANAYTQSRTPTPEQIEATILATGGAVARDNAALLTDVAVNTQAAYGAGLAAGARMQAALQGSGRGGADGADSGGGGGGGACSRSGLASARRGGAGDAATRALGSVREQQQQFEDSVQAMRFRTAQALGLAPAQPSICPLPSQFPTPTAAPGATTFVSLDGDARRVLSVAKPPPTQALRAPTASALAYVPACASSTLSARPPVMPLSAPLCAGTGPGGSGTNTFLASAPSMPSASLVASGQRGSAGDGLPLAGGAVVPGQTCAQASAIESAAARYASTHVTPGGQAAASQPLVPGAGVVATGVHPDCDQGDSPPPPQPGSRPNPAPPQPGPRPDPAPPQPGPKPEPAPPQPGPKPGPQPSPPRPPPPGSKSKYSPPDAFCNNVSQCTFWKCLGYSWAGLVYAFSHYDDIPVLVDGQLVESPSSAQRFAAAWTENDRWVYVLLLVVIVIIFALAVRLIVLAGKPVGQPRSSAPAQAPGYVRTSYSSPPAVQVQQRPAVRAYVDTYGDVPSRVVSRRAAPASYPTYLQLAPVAPASIELPPM